MACVPEEAELPGQDGECGRANAVYQHVDAGLRAACKKRYVKNGVPTSEIRSFQTALRPVRQLYGSVPVTDFGPLALVACRLKLIEAGFCRKRINQHVGRIRQMFKWGVAREMVPETVWRALYSVEGLRIGEAIERPPVRAVLDDAATRPPRDGDASN